MHGMTRSTRMEQFEHVGDALAQLADSPQQDIFDKLCRHPEGIAPPDIQLGKWLEAFARDGGTDVRIGSETLVIARGSSQMRISIPDALRSFLARYSGGRAYTLLYLSANPTASERLGVDVEFEEIRNSIERGAYRDLIRLESEWAVKAEGLFRAFNRHAPTVVHMSLHGTRNSEVCINGDDNHQHMAVSTDSLKELFEAVRDDTQLAVFNACYSCDAAREVSKVIPNAVGFDGAIADDSAIAFSRMFYSAIAEGRNWKESFQQAAALVKMRFPSELARPHMYRDGVAV